MPYILQVTLVGLLAGVFGTSFGGLLTVILRKPKDVMLSGVLAFSGGIMLAIVFADLIPESMEIGTMPLTFGGLFVGAAALKLLDVYLPASFHQPGGLDGDGTGANFRRTSVLLGFGIALHNLPEGLAIGAGYMASETLGLGLAIVIAIQNVPEGMAMAGPMKAARMPGLQIVTWTGLAGLPMGLGALAGGLLGSVSPLFLSAALGFAAGAMLYIVFDQLLPDAQRLGVGQSCTYGSLLGILFGLFVLVLVH